MKNLLIATTALVATAGVAAAEINFSGGARFGVKYTGTIAGTAKIAITPGAISAANVIEATRINSGSALSGFATAAGATGTASTNAVKGLIGVVASVTPLDASNNTVVSGSGFAKVDQDAAKAVVAAQAALDLAIQNGASTSSEVTTRDNAVTAAATAATNLADATALLAAISGADAVAAVAATASKSDLHNRFTLNIDGSTETDSGTEFFGRVRIRGGNTGDGATKASTVSAPRIGMKIGSLTIAVGNINGAIDSTAGVYSGSVGLTGLGYSNVIVGGYDGFSSGGGGSNGVEVIYSMEGMKAHLSHSSMVKGDRTALALTYAFGDWKVGFAHQSADLAAEEFTMVRVDGSIGDITLGAALASNDVSVGDKVRINAGFKVGAGTNVSFFVTDSDLAGADTAYGLGFTHSLGGATLAGGIVEDSAGVSKADLGVRFNF